MQRKLRWYFGGLWDGDGSFGITRTTHKNQYSQKRWVTYQPIAHITLCHKRAPLVFDVLQQEFGFFQMSSTRRDNPKWRIAHKWAICSQRACDFAKLLEPFLIIKKPQAQILIQWRKKWNGMSKEERQTISAKQEELYQRMKVLNKRGA